MATAYTLDAAKAEALRSSKPKYKPTALESLVVELADAAQARGRARTAFRQYKTELRGAADEAAGALHHWDATAALRRVELVSACEAAEAALEPWADDWPAGRPDQWVEVTDADARLAVIVAEVVVELGAHLDEVDAPMLEALAAGLATGPSI